MKTRGTARTKAKKKPRRVEPPAIRPVGRQHKFSLQQIEEALRRNGGIFTHAAKWLENNYGIPCSRKLIDDACRRNPHLHDLVINGREELKDMAEGGLRNLLINSDRSAIFYTLTNLAHDRGYGSNVRHVGGDGGPIRVTSVSASVDLSGRTNEEVALLYRQALGITDEG